MKRRVKLWKKARSREAAIELKWLQSLDDRGGPKNTSDVRKKLANQRWLCMPVFKRMNGPDGFDWQAMYQSACVTAEGAASKRRKANLDRAIGFADAVDRALDLADQQAACVWAL